MHTLTHHVHTDRTSGKTSGQERQTEQDEFAPSSEPSTTKNAQIRAWEQRTDHPRFQPSLRSNRLFFAPFALHPPSFPTTTTTPHKLTHLTHPAKLSLKWLALRYVAHLRQIPAGYVAYRPLASLSSSSSVANRPQVYWRLVDSITYTILSTTYTHLLSCVIGKAPRKQLATKAARKTAVVSAASPYPYLGGRIPRLL